MPQAQAQAGRRRLRRWPRDATARPPPGWRSGSPTRRARRRRVRQRRVRRGRRAPSAAAWAAARPAAKSSRRSSRSSSPTEQRSRPGAIPASTSSASVSWRWVVVGGWATIVWMLPSDAVSSGIVRASMNAPPPARPPTTSKASMPPPIGNWRSAQLVLGVAGQPRIDHPHDAPARSRASVARTAGRRRVALHPDGQRGQAAQDQERRQRRERAAGVDLDLADGRDPFARAGHHAGHDVRVAADELRRRLGHEVGPELDRAAQVRRGERVVDDEQRAVAVGEPGQGRDVGDHDRRIRDRLDVEHAGRRGRQGGLDRGQVGRVDEPVVTPSRPKWLSRSERVEP